MTFIKGQSGNPKGRPKGSRNKFSESFLDDLRDSWIKHGVKALDITARTKPIEFVRIAASILPKQVEATVRTELDTMDDLALKQFIQDELRAAQANMIDITPEPSLTTPLISLDNKAEDH